MAASITAHDNQSGLDLVNPPSTTGPNAVRVFDVPLVRATDASLAGFGRLVRGFSSKEAQCDITPFPLAGWRKLIPGTGDEGGVVEDVFRLLRDGRTQLAVNVGLGRKYVTGWYGSDPATPNADDDAATLFDSILTHEANYHPDGAQVFSSRDGAPFVLLLARPGDDVAPQHFRAFLVEAADGVTGVHVNAYVWHAPAFPVAGRPADLTLDNRQGRVHGCVGVSFIDEFGGYIRVPLSLAAVTESAAPAPSPAPPRLGYNVLYVADVDAALTFYTTAFNLRRRFMVPTGEYGELETGATALSFCARALAEKTTGAALGSSARGGPPSPSEVGLVVADVDAALSLALAAGAALVTAAFDKPWGQRVAYVRDLDGFLVELCTAM